MPPDLKTISATVKTSLQLVEALIADSPLLQKITGWTKETGWARSGFTEYSPAGYVSTRGAQPGYGKRWSTGLLVGGRTVSDPHLAAAIQYEMKRYALTPDFESKLNTIVRGLNTNTKYRLSLKFPKDNPTFPLIPPKAEIDLPIGFGQVSADEFQKEILTTLDAIHAQYKDHASARDVLNMAKGQIESIMVSPYVIDQTRKRIIQKRMAALPEGEAKQSLAAYLESEALPTTPGMVDAEQELHTLARSNAGGMVETTDVGDQIARHSPILELKDVQDVPLPKAMGFTSSIPTEQKAEELVFKKRALSSYYPGFKSELDKQTNEMLYSWGGQPTPMSIDDAMALVKKTSPDGELLKMWGEEKKLNEFMKANPAGEGAREATAGAADKLRRLQGYHNPDELKTRNIKEMMDERVENLDPLTREANEAAKKVVRSIKTRKPSKRDTPLTPDQEEILRFELGAPSTASNDTPWHSEKPHFELQDTPYKVEGDYIYVSPLGTEQNFHTGGITSKVKIPKDWFDQIVQEMKELSSSRGQTGTFPGMSKREMKLLKDPPSLPDTSEEELVTLIKGLKTGEAASIISRLKDLKPPSAKLENRSASLEELQKRPDFKYAQEGGRGSVPVRGKEYISGEKKTQLSGGTVFDPETGRPMENAQGKRVPESRPIFDESESIRFAPVTDKLKKLMQKISNNKVDPVEGSKEVTEIINGYVKLGVSRVAATEMVYKPLGGDSGLRGSGEIIGERATVEQAGLGHEILRQHQLKEHLTNSRILEAKQNAGRPVDPPTPMGMKSLSPAEAKIEKGLNKGATTEGDDPIPVDYREPGKQPDQKIPDSPAQAKVRSLIERANALPSGALPRFAQAILKEITKQLKVAPSASAKSELWPLELPSTKIKRGPVMPGVPIETRAVGPNPRSSEVRELQTYQGPEQREITDFTSRKLRRKDGELERLKKEWKQYRENETGGQSTSFRTWLGNSVERAEEKLAQELMKSATYKGRYGAAIRTEGAHNKGYVSELQEEIKTYKDILAQESKEFSDNPLMQLTSYSTTPGQLDRGTLRYQDRRTVASSATRKKAVSKTGDGKSKGRDMTGSDGEMQESNYSPAFWKAVQEYMK